MSGTRLGEEETEDLKRAVRNKTIDDHRLDINDPWVLGTRLGGTKAEKKKTMDDPWLDINDPWVLGTRLGGTKAEKKTEDEMMTLTDTKVKETKWQGPGGRRRDDK